jgi:hypothetical protein
MKVKKEIDPEKVMNKELQKKRDVALVPSSVALAEFASIYKATFKLPLVWTNPVTNWHFHLWVAPQAGREWLSEEQKAKREKAAVANKRRIQTITENSRRRRKV